MESNPRSLERDLLESCRDLLSRLEASQLETGLSPAEWSELFASVGELKFRAWSQILAGSAAQDVLNSADAFLQRLSSVWAAHGTNFLAPLQGGFMISLERISETIDELQGYLDRDELGSVLTSYEFDGMLMHPLDRFGFAIEAATALGIRLTPQVQRNVSRMMERLRHLLPKALVALQRAGDPLYRSRVNQFPTSFWWYRAGPIEES